MSNETVRSAIEDIALRPNDVGLLHAKILRDEIIELRSRVAESVCVLRAATDHAASAARERAAVVRRDVENLAAERDQAKWRIRHATQGLIEVVGATGPEDLEGVVERVITKLRAAEGALDERESHAMALVEVVHDALWSEQHRGEDVGDMARRVKADLAAIADENIALEEKLREALASTGRARYENTLARAEKAEAERDALARQVHRLIHDEEIESDHICDHELRMTDAERERDEIRQDYEDLLGRLRGYDGVFDVMRADLKADPARKEARDAIENRRRYQAERDSAMHAAKAAEAHARAVELERDEYKACWLRDVSKGRATIEKLTVECGELRVALDGLRTAGRRFEFAVHGGKPQSMLSHAFSAALAAAEKI